MYGPPPGYAQGPVYPGAGAARRPGTVTGAAVLAFIVGALLLLVGLIALVAGAALLGAAVRDGLVIPFAVVSLGVGALYIWAGVWALNGRNAMLLTIVAGIGALLQLVSLFRGGTANGVVGLAISVAILALLLTQPSRAWFRSRGAATF